jgi:hypothetical protein
MKSGWWSGDGGEFHNMLLPRIVKDCPLIDVEYYYLQFIDAELLPPGLPPGLLVGIVGLTSFYPERAGIPNDGLMVEANFPSRPWNEYTQVWLLSGGNNDPTDIPTTNPFFLKLLTTYGTQPATPSQLGPSLFLGAGLGHHDHANRVLATFQMPELFQTHSTGLLVPSANEGDTEVLSRVRRGAELVPHALFEGADTIVDRVRVGGMDVDTDFLLTANIPFQVIGQNTQGESAIAVRDTETRRFVLDTGVSRFYSLFIPTETNTYRYLHNIIKYLAR